MQVFLCNPNSLFKYLQKEVLQELIDQTKHAKVEAERDNDLRSRTRNRIAAKANNDKNKPQPLKKVLKH